MIINVPDAKAKLSKLVEMAYNGEEVIILKNNIPLVNWYHIILKQSGNLGC